MDLPELELGHRQLEHLRRDGRLEGDQRGAGVDPVAERVRRRVGDPDRVAAGVARAAERRQPGPVRVAEGDEVGHPQVAGACGHVRRAGRAPQHRPDAGAVGGVQRRLLEPVGLRARRRLELVQRRAGVRGRAVAEQLVLGQPVDRCGRDAVARDEVAEGLVADGVGEPEQRGRHRGGRRLLGLLTRPELPPVRSMGAHGGRTSIAASARQVNGRSGRRSCGAWTDVPSHRGRDSD